MTTPKYAIEWNRDALVADRRTVARLMQLGEALVDSAEHLEAENCYRQALFLAEQMENHDNMLCSIYVSLGLVLLQLNQSEEAKRLLHQAESLIDSGKVKARSHTNVYHALKQFYETEGDLDASQRYTTRIDDVCDSVLADVLRLANESQQKQSPESTTDAPTISSSSTADAPTPDLWLRVLAEASSALVLPIPTPDEAVCIAGVAQCAHDQPLPTVTDTKLREFTRVLRPKWDGHEVRSVGRRASQQTYFKPVVPDERPQDSNAAFASRSIGGPTRSGGDIYELAMPLQDLLAAICRGLWGGGGITTEQRQSLQMLGECLLDKPLKASLFAWLESV